MIEDMTDWRKPCEHGEYLAHKTFDFVELSGGNCPGGSPVTAADLSSLPTAGKSHRGLEAPSAVGNISPTSPWLVTRDGQPVPLRVPLPVRAAQLFSRVGILKSARGNVYDRLKIYRVTRAPR